MDVILGSVHNFVYIYTQYLGDEHLEVGLPSVVQMCIYTHITFRKVIFLSSLAGMRLLFSGFIVILYKGIHISRRLESFVE